MKRIASLTNVESLNCRSNGLFSQTPAKCGFNNEEGYARREFNKLCPKEQDQVIKDVYGIEESVDENPSFIRECLHRMEIELELYPGKVKRALELARNEHNSFFEDEKFRLKFLRTDKYDVKQAARRYVRFLEKKLELFGPEKLGKRITFEDLNDDDLETIRAGGIQPLPEKDRGGRVVLFTRHKNWKYNNIHNLVRDTKRTIIVSLYKIADDSPLLLDFDF